MLLDYIQNKAQNTQDLSIGRDDESNTYYIPLGIFDYEDDSQVLYATLSKVTFEESEYPESHIESGYEVTEEYVPLSDWEIINASESDIDGSNSEED